MRKKSLSKELSACETLLMKIIWDAKEDIAVQELIVRLKQQFDKEYARTTVVTFLGKMAEKGFVSTYRVGKISYVHAQKDEESYKQKMLREETGFWFDGKPSQLMSALCDAQEISKEEIEKMRKMLDELDN